MAKLERFIDFSFGGVHMHYWLLAVALVLATYAAGTLIIRILIQRLRKITAHTKVIWDDAIIDTLERTKGFFFVTLGAGLAVHLFPFPASIRNPLAKVTTVVVMLQVVIWGSQLIRSLIARVTRKHMQSGSQERATTLSALGFIGRIALFVVVVLVGLQNLGINVSALVAGLGIGGVAVALAVQNILGDLFASISIVLDKPFVVGDPIKVGEFEGTVESIGLKTTRVRAATGEEVVFSNTDLLTSRIQNMRHVENRRSLFLLGVTYQTPADKLAKIPALVRAAVETQKGALFQRAHLKNLGASSLDFEVLYFVKDGDFQTYVDVQQAVNLEIIASFAREGIGFAYPTQSIFVENAVRLATTDEVAFGAKSMRPAATGTS